MNIMLQRFSKLVCGLSAFGLATSLLLVAPAAAQEQSAPEQNSPDAAAQAAETQPAETQPAETPAAEAPPADDPAPADQAAPAEPSAAAPAGNPANSGDAVQRYQQTYEKWKTLIKEMRTLQAKYVTAKEGEAAEIEARWNELVQQGRELLPELREAGAQAYVAAPGQDLELERFLLKLISDDLDGDRYESAAELSQRLLEAGCEDKSLLDQAGIAAFVTDDYESAEKFLTAAREAGVLSDNGSNYLGLVPEYKQYWETEKKLREAEAQADDLPRVKVTTSEGEIVLELFENQAPDTVGNFVSLVEKGFYDGLTFHRVLDGFMAQGGCPLGTGSGGPGYNIYCECYRPDHRKHFRGSLSMAHAGKDTGGSQFFLTFVPTDHLNGKHTVFGRVIEGMDVLAKLQRIDPSDAANVEPSKIVKMEVLRKRDHEYKPNKVQ